MGSSILATKAEVKLGEQRAHIETLPPDALDAPAARPGSWWVDGGTAVVLFFLLMALRPAIPDGDGLDYAGHAFQPGFLEALNPKHLLYAPLLHGVLLLLEACGARANALEVFTLLSNLCGAALYLVLVRGFYPKFLPRVGLTRLCALGALLSFGVLSECCAIETYALALLLIAILLTLCVRLDLAAARGGLAAGVVFTLAVGVHAGNLLLGPFVLAVVLSYAWRRRSWLAPGWFLGAVLLGMTGLAVLLMIGKGIWPWSPNWALLLPPPDSQPPMTLTVRLGRVAFGLLRTLAWLPPALELTPAFVAVYGAATALAAGLIAFVARRGFVGRHKRYRRLALFLMVFTLPVAALAVYYYPSDPERWLFLTPLFWLVVGLVWTEYSPPTGAWLTPARAAALLVLVVSALGLYNAGYKLWPDARHDRELEGLRGLQDVTGPGDLVVASSGLKGLVEECILRKRLGCEVVALEELMRNHASAVETCRDDLRTRVRQALAQGRRVFAYKLLNEGLMDGRGYPWAEVQHWGYEPESFLSVLETFHPQPVLAPDEDRAGVYRLNGEQ